MSNPKRQQPTPGQTTLKTTLRGATSRSPFLSACVFIVLLLAQPVVAQQLPYSLADALDNTNLQFRTYSGGGLPWLGQTEVSHDGTDAATVIFPAYAYTGSVLSTTVTGPARVSYWWLLDSIAGSGFYFTLQLDGSVVRQPGPRSVWSSNYIDVPYGTHTLEWVAASYLTGSEVLAAVDEVTVTPLIGQAPQVTLNPPATTVQIGQTLALHADVTGTEPMSYSWTFKAPYEVSSRPVYSAYGSEMAISQFTRRDAGTYTLAVTNFFGRAVGTVVATAGFDYLAEALNQSNLTWSISGLSPLGNFCELTVQSPRPAWSSLRSPNQPSSTTKRSTPSLAALSASDICPASVTANSVASHEL